MKDMDEQLRMLDILKRENIEFKQRMIAYDEGQEKMKYKMSLYSRQETQKRVSK